MPVDISVIVPTRNRSAFLREALASVLAQTLPPESYEIIVVDNGSTDNTRNIVDELVAAHPGRIRYVFEEQPGLHRGRHRGAAEARSGLLVFVDDDIIADEKWLQAILHAFEDERVVLVGGKILPRWEGAVPGWIELFKTRTADGWWLGYLSLLDFGPERRPMPPEFVFGCNFAIRRQTLAECGGFHPDALPPELIRYRGDGETAVARAVRARGRQALYEPAARIHHRVPAKRLTPAYFRRRAFLQGISASFSEIRRHGGLPPSEPLRRRLTRRLRELVRPGRAPVVQAAEQAFREGVAFHREEVAKDPELLAYVLRTRYDEADTHGSGARA